MKALRKLSEQKIALVDMSEPTCNAGQVKIKVQYAGICASDLHIIKNDIKLNMTTPVTLGHEFSGIIVESRSPARSVGQLVTSETTFSSCGTCEWCKSNQYNLCKTKQLIGYWWDGAFAEYIVVPVERTHIVKSPIQGALIEPLACVCHALYNADVHWQNKNVVIAGPGVIGQLAAYTLFRDNLSTRLTMIGIPSTSVFRIQRAKTIAEYINADDIYKTRIHGDVDVYVECSGTKKSIDTGLNVLKRGGTFIQIGLTSKHDDGQIDFSQIAYKELNVKGFIGSNIASWRTAKMLMNQKLANFIQPTMFSLDEYEIALAYAESGETIKTMFRM